MNNNHQTIADKFSITSEEQLLKINDEITSENKLAYVVAMKSLLKNGGVVKNLQNILSTAITADYNLYGIHGKKSLKDVSHFYAALKASFVAPAGKSVEDQLRRAIQNQKKKNTSSP
ncbi:PREDICTED: uncharacterized protein LOC108370708 isoform X1 [Rhagoletis zephyria]|uniref:uncharacterized protein LOC108370708 isoform X1 n=1 Tax=Rhagoletis zephyria TaxID=28612 RepID=UPI00081163C3|nr:PREDICTED: uncharacterized protein LOC108370708 isoform X1 [Rhagoletis zephyria]